MLFRRDHLNFPSTLIAEVSHAMLIYASAFGNGLRCAQRLEGFVTGLLPQTRNPLKVSAAYWPGHIFADAAILQAGMGKQICNSI